MKHIDWSAKVKGNDWRWEAAEDICRDIASTGKDLDDPNRPRDWQGKLCAPFRSLAPFEHLSGYGNGPPWVHNPRTDRVIAYHGFAGTWVGWEHGGAVIDLKFTDIVRYLRGEM